ncbi:MAG: iron-sulfur cluster assembly scaffold protein [Patescibacteria group bacterium]|nr:iron-sulfur cluster assembly scaffold protein [Patescibacteria group bacterium]MBU2509073.1 iron-sulfur cluster assembly scaffold protein [Patescibacteria group bacterium]
MNNKGDIVSHDQESGWFYSDEVKDHFFNPRNYVEDESALKDAAMGMVGSPACGDVMKVWIKVDPATLRITEMKWKTFGCASAIASTSVLSVMVTENGGMSLEDASKITPRHIVERLGGLPARKIHCSVLGDQALRKAIEDWEKRYK